MANLELLRRGLPRPHSEGNMATTGPIRGSITNSELVRRIAGQKTTTIAFRPVDGSPLVQPTSERKATPLTVGVEARSKKTTPVRDTESPLTPTSDYEQVLARISTLAEQNRWSVDQLRTRERKFKERLKKVFTIAMNSAWSRERALSGSSCSDD